MLVTLLYLELIKSFRHRELKRLFGRGDRSLIRPDLVDTIENILFLLSVGPR